MNVLVDARAEHTASQLAAVGADAPIVEHSLRHALIVGGPHRTGGAHHVGDMVLLGAVPSAIAAGDEPFVHLGHLDGGQRPREFFTSLCEKECRLDTSVLL